MHDYYIKICSHNTVLTRRSSVSSSVLLLEGDCSAVKVARRPAWSVPSPASAQERGRRFSTSAALRACRDLGRRQLLQVVGRQKLGLKLLQGATLVIIRYGTRPVDCR